MSRWKPLRMITSTRVRSTSRCSAALGLPWIAWSGHSTCWPYGMAIVSYGLRPGCALANERWPGGCQSWVANAWSKRASSRLITGTTASPSATASSPPGMKVGCTSTSPSMSVARSIIGLTPWSVARDDSMERRSRGAMRPARCARPCLRAANRACSPGCPAGGSMTPNRQTEGSPSRPRSRSTA